MEDLVLLGGGGHCRAVIDVVERTGRYRIAGIVDGALAKGSEVAGYPVLGADEDLPALRREIGHGLVSVGQIRSAAVRMKLFARLEDAGFALATVISPLAEVSRRAQLGRGSVAMHFAAIGPACAVGVNAIVNTRALIEHDCRIGDHCHISTGALLNGGVKVGNGVFIGSGSVLRDGIDIADGAFVAMGARVIGPVGAGEIFKGVRA